MSDQTTSSNPKDEKIDAQKMTIKVIKLDGVPIQEPQEETFQEEASSLQANEEKVNSLPALPQKVEKSETPKDGSSQKETKKKTNENTFLADVLDFVKVLAVCSIGVLLFLNFIAHPVNVSGHSMDPSLADGEYGFTSILSVALSAPERGEIVIINQEGANGQTERWVKRIIGLPGETIEAKDGVVYIDGQPLDESSYLNEDYIEETLAKYQAEHGMSYGPFTFDFGPVTLGENEYWVMGDNRPYSKDSRYIGPITGDSLFGKGLFVLFPFNKAGVK